MPESDVAAEGFPELTNQEFIERCFDGESDRDVWVIRFVFEPLTKKRDRPKGKRNSKSASGSLVPITEKRKGKTYPVVSGDRCPKSEAFNHPSHYNWFYQWSVWDGEKWRTKSKRVPCTRIYSIKYLISCNNILSPYILTK
ncbi:MAG: hypothetical protein WA896_12135 [Spirulinaceae cyanobacterium]